MEIKIKTGYKFAFLNGNLFVITDFPKIGWGYITANADEAKAYGFGVITSGCGTKLNFLPIKDIAHTRGFYSDVYCKYKGNELAIDSCYNSSFNVAPCTLEVALAVGFTAEKFNYEYAQMNVQITEIDEIYRRREKLKDFIFDVDPIKPIYKDGKWLIEPDENGVYVI
ncbi:MAG: hypothetical protein J5676_06510 [Bacteroidaceae bacterium]|nr:hypothetical protein [Bacteroidaceae bacterium]